MLSLYFILFFTSCVELFQLNNRILNFDHPQIIEFPSRPQGLVGRSVLPERVYLSFFAHGQLFELELEQNHALLEDAVFYHARADGELVPEYPPFIAYKGVSVDARITFQDIESKLFEGYIVHDSEFYFVIPTAHEEIDEFVRDSLAGNMLVIKQSDMIELEDRYCGNGDHFHQPTFTTRQTSLDFSAPLLDPLPTTCPYPQKKLIVSVMTDTNYSLTYPSTSSQVITHMNAINGIFVKHGNIQIVLGNSYIGISNNFTSTCNPDINSVLGQFSAFRGNQTTDKAGLFALFTGCYRSGTVGLAWKGVVCKTNASPQPGGPWSGTSVSSVLGANGFLVAAHEIGHNFGCDHDSTTGGIMYPTVSTSQVFSQVCQQKICNSYQININTTGCFTDAPCTPVCTGVCGPNGCGRSCGTCPTGQTCSNGTCVVPCQPNCTGKQCGDNGCGGSCGTCSAGVCSSNMCVCSNCSTNWAGNIYVTMHNDARFRYKSANLTWSSTLLTTAVDWVNRCDWTYYASGSFGANKVAAYGAVSDPATVLGGWTDQEKNWVCSTDVCTTGSCSQLRNMIWANSTSFACSSKVCSSTTGVPPASTWTTWTYTVCLYNPAGSWVGQRPVTVGNCPGTCTPTKTCATQGFNCGSFVDDCGKTVTCGTCTTGNTCSSNKCVCAPSASCNTTAQTQCGPISNGCGVTLNCGNCASPYSCSNGTCVCRPTTNCTAQNLSCGTIANDGCGNQLLCGSCATGSSCVSGVCSTSCTPTRTCASVGATCGTIDSGCGLITCGSCTSTTNSLQCVNGTCKCVPNLTCASAGKTCGSLFDGCNTISCGSCLSNQQCQSGVCVGCSTCSQYATCNTQLQCVCNAGYTGNGATCTPISDVPVVTGAGNWEVVEGSGWTIGSNTIQYPATTTADSTINWKDCQNLPYESKRTFAVRVQRQTGNQMIGVAFNTNLNKYNYFRWITDGTTSGGKILVGYKTRSSSTAAWATSAWDWNMVYPMVPGTWYQWVLVATGTTTTLNLTGTVSTPTGSSTSYYTINVNWGQNVSVSSGFGLTAKGAAIFTNATFVTQTTVRLSLVSCVSETQLRTSIAAVLYVSPSTIGPITINCGKRQGEATAFVTFYSVPDGPSSAALASQLSTYIADSHPSLTAAGLFATSASFSAEQVNTAGFFDATQPPPNGGSSSSGGGGNGGVGPGVYVPIIVIGAIALLVAVTAFVSNNKREKEHRSAVELTPIESRGGKPASTRKSNPASDDNILYEGESAPPEPGTLPSTSGTQDHNRPKQAAVDVMGRDEHTSITARSPAVKQ